MKLTAKSLIFSVVICIFTVMRIFISCNKGSSPNSTTIVKCVTCANGGLCINDTCRCPVGYEGPVCETLSVDKFMGTWNVFEKGTLTPSEQYSIEIQSGFNPTSVDSLTIDGLYHDVINQAEGYVVVDTLYIPSQQYLGYIIIGKGYIHSDPTFGQDGAITMSYAVTDTATGKTDDFGYYSSADSPSLWSK
jgi:hypothetical protein